MKVKHVWEGIRDEDDAVERASHCLWAGATEINIRFVGPEEAEKIAERRRDLGSMYYAGYRVEAVFEGAAALSEEGAA